MDTTDKVQKNLQNALKLSGFNIRREFCCLLVTSFIEGGVDLNDGMAFETMIRNLCASLENQCLAEKSIEKEHIERAIEVCLHSGYDRYESIFNIINAFDFPKLSYNPDRKLYFIDKSRSTLLAKADIKAKLFLDRYYTILQRTKRNFQQKVSAGDKNQLKLQTVDYLLTLSNVTLEFTLILGSLIQVSEGKWHLEDPTGMVELNLTHAKFHAGFFMENCVVLVNGYYEDRILHVSTVVLPPGEEYANSRISFGSLNYFGGNSSVPLRDSLKLKEHLNQNKSKPILFFSDVWLDHQLVLTKMDKKIRKLYLKDFVKDSSSNIRLNSIRHPRDLSLGGTKIHKKKYEPNINVVRNKNKSHLNRIEKPSLSQKNAQNKLKQRLMQSTGVFSEGVGPTIISPIDKKAEVKKSGKKTNLHISTSEKTYQELGKKNRMDLFNELVEYQSSSDSEMEEKHSFEPHHWNIQNEMKFDNELLAIFENISNTKTMVWQMPSSLPFEMNPNVSKTNEIVDRCLTDFPQGKIGKMLIRKSGKIEVIFGNIKYDLISQLELCYETLVSLNIELKRSLVLKKVDNECILVPNWSRLMQEH